MAKGQGEVEPQSDELSRMLESELQRQARPLQGCWPLAVAIAGLLLGLLLVLRWL